MQTFWLLSLIVFFPRHSFSIKIKDLLHKRQGSEDASIAKWPVSCNLKTAQSPINLPNICSPSFGLTIDPSLRVDFINYDQVLPQQVLKMKNNGFSASLYIKGAKNVRAGVPGINGSMTGGNFYQFCEVHFHSLSEHRVEGVRQPLEAQLVHFNTRFKNKKRAMRRRDGLLILSVLFKEIGRDEGMDDFSSKEQKKDNIMEDEDPGQVMRFITDHLSGITRINTDCQFRSSIRLSSLLPSYFFDSFYTYRGSTTSPPCHESVIWVISAYVKPIHSKYLCHFAQLDLPGEKRDVQSLNSRTVFVNSLSCCLDSNRRDFKESLSYLALGNDSSSSLSRYASFWADPVLNDTVVFNDDDIKLESEENEDVVEEE